MTVVSRSAAPPCAVVRSPHRCFSRKRGPRSLQARLKRFAKYNVHTKNLLHGTSVAHDGLTSGVSTSDDLLPSIFPNTSESIPSHSEPTFPSINTTTPSDNAPQSQSSSSANVPDTSSTFSILHLNVRGWRSHVDELSAYIDLLDTKPSFIAVNETFLNKSVVVNLPGYKVVARRDRFSSSINAHVDNLQSWGGVLLLTANELDGSVVEVLSSDTAERLWFILHCNVGPLYFVSGPLPRQVILVQFLRSMMS